jgi:hypothetical protein
MLADPDSKTIRAYGVLNEEATGMQRGFARPGYFFINPNGIIREKFFEAKYRERLTGNSIISKLFPELGQDVTETVEAPHLQLALEQSDRTGVPGTRITLAAEVRLPPCFPWIGLEPPRTSVTNRPAHRNPSVWTKPRFSRTIAGHLSSLTEAAYCRDPSPEGRKKRFTETR